MPGARAGPRRSVIAAQLLGTFGLSLSKASAHQHNHDVEQLLESLTKGQCSGSAYSPYPGLVAFSEKRNGTGSPPSGSLHQPSSPCSIIGRAWYAVKWCS